MKKEKRSVNKTIFILPIILAICLFSIISISADITLPVASGNYTKSLSIAVATGTNGNTNITNVTCYYNTTAGIAQVFLVQMLNSTPAQTSFTGSATLTTEATTYNITCLSQNLSQTNSTFFVNPVTIDGTAPTLSTTIDQSTNYQTKDIGLNWTCTDSVSGVASTTISLTASGDAGCVISGTSSWSTATGSQLLTGTQTQCAGLYTLASTCVDSSGNSATDSDTFNIYYPEGGSGTLNLGQTSQVVQTKSGKVIPVMPLITVSIIVVIFIIIVASFFIISQSKKGGENMKKNFLDWIVFILLIIGGLNWGLAVFNFNLVEAITFNMTWLTKTVYGLVALSAIYGIYMAFKLK